MDNPWDQGTTRPKQAKGLGADGSDISEPDVVSRQAPLTVTQAAAYLNVTERFIRRLVAERRVRFLKVGRFVRFDPVDLDGYLEACRVEPVPGRAPLWPPR